MNPMTREAARAAFVTRAGWAGAALQPLAGDASARRYHRLVGPGGTAVLMDAPGDKGQDVRPFLRIDAALAAEGLSPPRILAADAAEGFLLLEDLGDALFARLVDHDPDLERTLYLAATDVLLRLHRVPAPAGLPRPSPADLATAVAPVLDWYLPGCEVAAGPAAGRILPLMEAALAALDPAPAVMCLRDYHAENLLWLPDRAGAARVGLLDFQDAFAGHPAYDLVSLLQDARRDVSPAVQAAATDHYQAQSGIAPASFARALATLGAQRNLRILGIFARLSMHFAKPHYVDLIPRVWAHLQADLRHPDLAPLAACLAEALPAPTPDRLQRIKDKCGTCPTA